MIPASGNERIPPERGGKSPDPAGKLWKSMERGSSIPAGSFWIFSSDFRSFPAGKRKKISEFTGKIRRLSDRNTASTFR
jgi:hypothetical protein